MKSLLSNDDDEEEADLSLCQKCRAWFGLTRIFCYVSCSKMMACACLKKKEPRRVIKHRSVLVLGLDGAGKSTILDRLMTVNDPSFLTNVLTNCTPTKGVNTTMVVHEEFSIRCLEVGGSEQYRQYWQRYAPNIDMLLYVVDSSAGLTRLEESLSVLADFLGENAWRKWPVLVLATKADVRGGGSLTEGQVRGALSDLNITSHQCHVMACTAGPSRSRKEQGLEAALHWMEEALRPLRPA